MEQLNFLAFYTLAKAVNASKNTADQPGSYLTFTVIAAAVTVMGSLFAMFIKDFVIVRYFNKKEEESDLKKISKKYKDPILLSAKELLSRVESILECYKYDSKYFTKETLFDKAESMVRSHPADPYYLRHRLTSTLYRFCAFWGWIELYRQDITFLDSFSDRENLNSLKYLSDVRVAIADGQINNAPNWRDKKDALIFREELRSVGEGMIELVNNQRTVIGYGKFQKVLRDYETSNQCLWVRPVIHFFTDLRLELDFRKERFVIIESSLREYIKSLDEKYFDAHVKKDDSKTLTEVFSEPVHNAPDRVNVAAP